MVTPFARSPRRPSGLTLQEALEWEVPYEETEECIRWYDRDPNLFDPTIRHYGVRHSIYRVVYQCYRNGGVPLSKNVRIYHTSQCRLKGRCINWKHLAVFSVGRAPSWPQDRINIAETHAFARLTNAQALAIYNDTMTPTRMLAERYRVTMATIRSIRCGLAWRSVTGASAVRSMHHLKISPAKIRAIFRDNRSLNTVARAHRAGWTTVRDIRNQARQCYREAIAASSSDEEEDRPSLRHELPPQGSDPPRGL